MNTKKMGLYEKVINIILDIFIFLFGLILLISLYKGIQVKILGNKYSSFFGYATFEVQTGSMRPTIEAGDWIIVKVTDDIKIGDIVTYSKNDEFITHTVIESYKGTYITKGDANNTKDEPITKDQIVGKVTKTLKHFGIFRKTLFNPYVLITSSIDSLTKSVSSLITPISKPSGRLGRIVVSSVFLISVETSMAFASGSCIT